jgi:hypothetical protein
MKRAYNLSFEEWKEKYKPMRNPFLNSDYFDFVSDEEKEFIRKQNLLTVWTYGSGDFGGQYIWNDWHTVGRFGYYVTEVPYRKGDMIIVVIEEAPDVPVNFWTRENLVGEIK